MWKRDKLFKNFRNDSDGNVKTKFYNDYKKLRNELTTLKRNNKLDYYKQYFEENKKKTAALWKGIRSNLVFSSLKFHLRTLVVTLSNIWLLMFGIP